MIYFSVFSVAAAGGSNTWRLSFPSGSNSGGGAGSNLVIDEVEMFSEASPATDLCTGGTAAASSVDGSEVADNAFDGVLSSNWRVAPNQAIGSWLQYQFPASQEITHFRIFRNGVVASPIEVDLQSVTGGTPTTAINYPTVVWDASEWLDFNADGTISGNYTSNAHTSGSGSAYATKGNILDALIDLQIENVNVFLFPVGTETYKVVGALVSTSTGQITSILGETAAQNVTGDGGRVFTFPSPLSISSGERVALMAVRTDGTSTSPARVGFPTSNGAVGPRLTRYGAVRYATLTPTVGDSVVFSTSASVRMTVRHTF